MGKFPRFCCRLLTFFKNNFFKKFYHYHVLSVLIWAQTVCKGYHQTKKVAANKEKVKKVEHFEQRVYELGNEKSENTI